jgi:hypothetical protein
MNNFENDGKFHGSDGLFWRVEIGDERSYARIIRVLYGYEFTLPSNVFLVESGTIDLDDEWYEKALHGEAPSENLAERVYTILAHFGADTDSHDGENYFMLGRKPDAGANSAEMAHFERISDRITILHGNTNLVKFIRNEFLEGQKS